MPCLTCFLQAVHFLQKDPIGSNPQRLIGSFPAMFDSRFDAFQGIRHQKYRRNDRREFDTDAEKRGRILRSGAASPLH